MGKQRITVELDDETIRALALLGEPIEVLAHLAFSAADGVRRPDHPKREQTNESLKVERHKSDVAIASERAALDEKADDVVRVARQRADQVVQTARDDARGERSPRSVATEARSARARTVLEHERSDADAMLEGERADRRTDRADFLAVERDATDSDLSGERAHADTLIVDQSEVNARLIRAAILAQELTERAEKSEGELRAVAEFREMFIGILGHDLRNPLSSIGMGAALLLRRGNLDQQDAETVARIIRGIQRMSRMIRDLLDLTRARLGGGFPIVPEPADLREICRIAVEEFETTIQLDLEGDVTGNWDEDRLVQVLSNIVGNAIDSAAPGTVVVVKAHAEGAEVVVEVRNQGDPIPADLLPFIFEPFRRAKQRRKSATGHLGLGLFIAKQVVLSHGGTLDAHSAGGTTSLVMRLPRGVA